MDYLLDFILLAFIYVLFFYRKWNKKSKKHLILNSIIYVYIVMVLIVTVMPFTLPFGGTNNLFMETANFIPFRDLMANYSGAARELLLNVIMMMPFGFLYPISKKKGALSTVALTFLFSLIIESSQLLSAWWGGLHSRTFDVTDLITNTFGGLLGYLIFLVLRPAVQKILKEY
ncbi:VanZ family protein [Paenibacillus dendritiformis]|uniref:VanZ family protein n=1 Tax=Paenibacillus dendritiformis TaxID=130049 RepID=UPI003657A9E5